MQKRLRRSRESRVDFLHGGASSDASDVACSWKKAAAAAHPLLSTATPPPYIRPSRPMRIVSSGGEAGLHLKKYYFCAPSPPPSPLSTSVRGGGGRSAVGDQQASAGRSRGRRLSELCSLSPSWQAHSAPVRAAGSCGRLPAGGRTAGEDNSPVTPCRRRRMLQHPHPS